jgi:hypothetical protein
MWRKTACAVGGLALACATAYSLSSTESNSRVTSFDLRWLYEPAKQDRLPVTQSAPAQQVVMAFNVPSESTTVVTKGSLPARVESAVQRPRTVQRLPVNPVREVPKEEKVKDKLMDGCEPAFSPVTSPALAHISGRCDS